MRARNQYVQWLAVAILLSVVVHPHTASGQSGSRGAGPAPNARVLGPASFRDRVMEHGGAVLGPQGQQPPVVDVRVVGNETIDRAEVETYLRTRPGRFFDPQLIEADIRRLRSSKLFSDVRTFTEPTPTGIIVTFEVFERPRIRYVRYIGNRKVRDKTLGKQDGLDVGDSLNAFSVEEGRRKLEEYYQSKGFPAARVAIAEGTRPSDKGVVYMVTEGPLLRINSVGFIGNVVASDGKLKAKIQSKPGYLKYYFRGKFDMSKVEQDMQALTQYYRSLGYFAAKVGRELNYDESGEWVDLTFVINEGPRWKVRNVSVIGNQKLTADQLMNQLQLKQGDYFNLSAMNGDVNRLRDLYGGQGHIFADIKSDPRFLEQPGQLDLVYNINEGDVFRVGRINVHIRGDNPHTRRSVVLNRLSLKPGDIIDIREVRASERRLKASQLFENNPAQGVAPKIVIRPPEVDELVAELQESGGSGSRAGAFRGQSPDPPMVLDIWLPKFRLLSMPSIFGPKR